MIFPPIVTWLFLAFSLNMGNFMWNTSYLYRWLVSHMKFPCCHIPTLFSIFSVGEILCEMPVTYIGNWYFTWNFPFSNYSSADSQAVPHNSVLPDYTYRVLPEPWGKFPVKCKRFPKFANSWYKQGEISCDMPVHACEFFRKSGKYMWNSNLHGFCPKKELINEKIWRKGEITIEIPFLDQN